MTKEKRFVIADLSTEYPRTAIEFRNEFESSLWDEYFEKAVDLNYREYLQKGWDYIALCCVAGDLATHMVLERRLRIDRSNEEKKF